MNLNKITQTYLQEFPGDFSLNPMQRQTPEVLFSLVQPVEFQNAELILFNEKLSEEIGLGKTENENDKKFLSAAYIPQYLKTYATAYAGHQFGNWAGQLGDGRVIFAGEIENILGKKTEIQWKGAGATPYSRNADGRAVLRSSVREYLMSEAVHHLKIPTTRALSISLTGENVVRDILYDGNPEYEKGAVIMRTAESFLRFGHFELLSARKETGTLQKLADFAIKNYFTDIDPKSPEKYTEFFQQISEKTADLMVEWQRTGFVHGVMNTDNMSILGLTMDYGPFSFLDEYLLSFTPNTTDLPGRRYAFGNQPKIAQWNLWQLANALFPLINDEKTLEKTLNDFSSYFWKKHDEMMAEKFGFGEVLPGDDHFFTLAQKTMEELEADYTLFFKKLEELTENSDLKLHFKEVFYSELSDEQFLNFEKFISKYKNRLEKNTISKTKSLVLMKENNPKFILRNYLLFECIEELKDGKKDLLQKLLTALENPYEEIFPEFSVKRPQKYDGQSGCSMLSFSSLFFLLLRKFSALVFKQKFTGFLKTVFPATGFEFLLFLVFLSIYGILGTFIALNYRIIFDDRIPWDAYFSFDNRAIVMTGGGFERHPLSNYFFEWIREFAFLFSGGKKDETFRLVLAWCSNFSVSLSLIQIYKYLKNIIVLPKKISLLILIFFAFFSTTVLLSFTPETYTYTLFFLVLFNYYAALKLRKEEKIPAAALTLAGISIGGLTVTNIVKVYIPLLFEKNVFRNWRKFGNGIFRILVSVSVFVLIFLYRLNFNYLNFLNKTEEQYERFSKPMFTPVWDMIASWFLGGNILFSNYEIRDYHNQKGFQYKALFMDVYDSLFSYLFVAVLFTLVFWSYFRNFRNRFVQILMISFFVDVIIHCVLKFGLHTSYIYGGHFVFVLPLMLGWLFFSYKNSPKMLSFLYVTVFILFFHLIANNLFRIKEFFEFLNLYYS